LTNRDSSYGQCNLPNDLEQRRAGQSARAWPIAARFKNRNEKDCNKK